MAAPNLGGIDEIVAKVNAARTVVQSATVFVTSAQARVEAAVKAAIEADDAGDQGTVDAAVAAAHTALQPFVDDVASLASALTANTPQAPPA